MALYDEAHGYASMGSPPKKPVNPLEAAYNLKNTATEQQAGDYSSIMDAYRNLLANSGGGSPGSSSTIQKSTPIGYTPISSSPMSFSATGTPESASYIPHADRTAAISNLGELSRTGGYSDQGIADLRARAISPIRSIYAGANREVDRQRGLQGGYSPNYNASKIKMARDQSEMTGGAITNVNAGIAQNVAQNRLSAAPNYASAAASESNAQNDINTANIAARNRVNELNATGQNDVNKFNAQQISDTNRINAGNVLDVNKFNAGVTNDTNRFNAGQQNDASGRALSGMASLYGTTPALTSTFGNQALSAAELQNQITQQNKNRGITQVGQAISGVGR